MSEFFYLKIFSFLEVKFSIYLNRRVFVMKTQVFLYGIEGPIKEGVRLMIIRGEVGSLPWIRR